VEERREKEKMMEVIGSIILSIVYCLVFPGLIFTALVGMAASYIDRKVTARVQWRVGPPLLQPYYDFVKLLTKEVIIPKGASKWTFLLAPVIGMAAVVIVSVMIWTAMINKESSFNGDLLLIIYLLVVPSIMVIIGGFASANPLASLGASREMKLIIAYELPFVIAMAVPVIGTGYTIRLGEIISFQRDFGVITGQLSGLIAFLVVMLCVQAKLSLVPFDMAEAETEIIAGPLIEYSGAPLAIYKLTRMMLLFVVHGRHNVQRVAYTLGDIKICAGSGYCYSYKEH